MTNNKITPEAFNEAAWNLGLPLRWNDKNHNGEIEAEEIRSTSTDFFAAGPDKIDQLRRLIEKGARGDHLKVIRTPEYIAGLDKKVESARARKDAEALRTTLRDRDMAYRGWAYHDIDFTGLPESEQKAAWILLQEVAPAVEAVHALQTDPNNLKYLTEIAATENFSDYVHAYFSGGPWCQEITDPACTSHPGGVPQRVSNAGTWPAGYTKDDVEKVQNDPDTQNNNNLLSNFVTRYLDTDGKLKWRSLNADNASRPYLTQISDGMKKAAAIPGIDPTLRKFLEARADEFGITTDAYPFYYGDTAWIGTKGGLDVTLGFYEVDDSPFESTGWIQGYVGPVEKIWEERGKHFQALVPVMEKNVSVELGKAYSPRDFSKGLPPLLFANLVGNGDPRVKYVPAGYHLPNISPYGASGVSKNVFGMNHQVARLEGVMRPMGEIVVHPTQRKVTKEDLSNFVVAHENAHSVGPQIKEKHLASPMRGALEEAKADQEGIASLPMAVQNGLLTKEEADQTCVAMLYSLLRGLSYGMSDSHGIGSFIEFTTLYQQGGIIEKDGFYMVNFKDGAIYKAAERVGRRIEKIQLKSNTDSVGAKKEAEEWLAQAQKDLPRQMKDRFLPKLVAMPKDVLPWYHFRFSPKVEEAMNNGERELAGPIN